MTKSVNCTVKINERAMEILHGYKGKDIDMHIPTGEEPDRFQHERECDEPSISEASVEKAIGSGGCPVCDSKNLSRTPEFVSGGIEETYTPMVEVQCHDCGAYTVAYCQVISIEIDIDDVVEAFHTNPKGEVIKK